MNEIALFAAKVPLLTAASVVLLALGIATLPITLLIGLRYARVLKESMTEVEETGDESAAAFVVPFAGLLAMLPVLGFTAPVMLWRDAIKVLKEDRQ